MFSETLLDHFQFPRNVGELDNPEAEAEAENPICGDRLHLFLRIEDNVIQEARWRAEGCAPAIAAASMLSELVQGLSVDDARQLDRDRLAGALGGLPPRKAHAAALAIAVLRQALP